MVQIATLVFFDIETTGLPWQERNRTKITEMAFVSVTRKDIMRFTTVPPVSKLTFALNPQKEINPKVTEMTGLSNYMLKYSPSFFEKSKSLVNFLDELQKPVCLVSHNGNCFDFKILLAECADAEIALPSDLYCVDSLTGFRKLLKEGSKVQHIQKLPDSIVEPLLTDDEDEWPALNVSNEDWHDIDIMLMKFSDISCTSKCEGRILQGSIKTGDSEKYIRQVCINNHVELQADMNTFATEFEFDEKIEEEYRRILREREMESRNIEEKPNTLRQQAKDNTMESTQKKNTGATRKCSKKGEFTLTGLYKRLLNKEAVNAHRAEDDCLMLLECVMALKDDFLPWADGSCKKLTEIKPLIRY